MKCYVTYTMSYEIEVPEENLNDLYDDVKEEYDPNKVYEYFNNMSIDWNDYYDVSLVTVDTLDETIFF